MSGPPSTWPVTAACVESLEASAARLGVAVRFHGEVSDEEKARLFRSCDVYCAPNLGGESFGIVLVEAMAAGCPVVCSDLEEFRVVAGDAALLAARGDPTALADALRSVLTDPERARSLGAVATARAGAVRLEPDRALARSDLRPRRSLK